MPKGCYARPTAEQRFWRMVRVLGPDDCWPWLGRPVNGGYGMIRVGDERIMAHRFAYELAFGRPPDNLLVCHRCDNPPCQNARHFFLGTAADNVRDMVTKGRCGGGRPVGRFHVRPPAAKLTEQIVREVRRVYVPRDERFGAAALARLHGVTKQSMLKVLKRGSWRHLSDS